MRTRTSIVPVLLVLLAPALFGACAVSPPRSIPDPARGAAFDSATIVIEVNMRRSAEVADGRGTLRVFDQDVRVEYRRGGRGPGLDAGVVTLDDRPMRRKVGRAGAVSFSLGRDLSRASQAADDPWMTLAHHGSASIPDGSVRIKMAPFPVVTQPGPGQSILRTDELAVVMLPPAAGVWYRVTLTGPGDAVTALDLGQGRWLFPRGALQNLGPGQAHVLIETETSCGDCELGERLRGIWSSRSELEVPLTLL